jgi:hypothetical protein
MHFKEHSNLAGAHAFLSPSSYHWINYTTEKLTHRWHTAQASILGVEHHRFADEAIARGWYQDDDTTLSMYINDCIRFRMTPEVLLYYSDNCFGTADAIAYRYGKLRISDYKSGMTKASIHQLEVYAAIFCLEYEVHPWDIQSIQLRIYQFGECHLYDGDPDFILQIMEKIIAFDSQLNILRQEEKHAID